MHPRIINEVKNEVACSLHFIFELSIKQKTANITAIHKKGNRKNPENYRLVSLTCVIWKLIETIIIRKVIDHLKENQLITRKQYGFMSGHSTVPQLITNCIGKMDKYTR